MHRFQQFHSFRVKFERYLIEVRNLESDVMEPAKTRAKSGQWAAIWNDELDLRPARRFRENAERRPVRHVSSVIFLQAQQRHLVYCIALMVQDNSDVMQHRTKGQSTVLIVTEHGFERSVGAQRLPALPAATDDRSTNGAGLAMIPTAN
jgi:hypothetical protein